MRMKSLNTIILKARKHARGLAAFGIILASVLVIPRRLRHWLRSGRLAQPPDQTRHLTQTHERASLDVPPARLNQTSMAPPPPSQRKLFRAMLLKDRNHRRALVIIAGITLAVLLSLILFHIRKPTKTTYYIAYMGRYQRKNFDKLHELALSRYIDDLNEDLRDVRLELKIFNTRVAKDINDSKREYEKIAGDDRYIAVIDNGWGRHLQTVADLIRDRGIPVIGINANKQTEDYHQNVVFMGYDDGVPKKVTMFSNNILKNEQTIFIGEEKESFPSTGQFISEFESSGINRTELKVTNEIVNEAEKKRLFDELRTTFGRRDPQQRVTVIINTHANWGDEIVKYINDSFKRVDMIGGPYIINSPNPSDFGQQKDNRLIIFTYPRDATTKEVYTDLKDIKSENPEIEFEDLNAELYVKRCLDAMYIIRSVLSARPPQQPTISRIDFRYFFCEKLADNYIVREDEVYGNNEIYAFDNDLRVSDQRTFEQYYHGEVSSSSRQMSAEGGTIFNITFGLDNLNISNVDTKNRSFHADFLYWLKSDQLDVEKYIHFRNQKTEFKKELIPVYAHDTKVHLLYKVSGEFSMDVDLRRYPLDTQELKIELEIIYPAESVRITFDRASFRSKKESGVDEWYSTDPYVTVDNAIASSLGGGPSLAEYKPQTFKTLNVRKPISRRWESPVVTIFLPLVIIGIIAVASLYVKDSSFANVGNVCVGLFLGMVTYSIAFAQITPRANVLTIADKLFFGTFLTVLFVFLKVIFVNSSWMSKRLRNRLSNQATVIGIVASIVYCLMIGGILIFGLT